MLLQNVSLHNKVILITGAAGFVGANLVMSLLIILKIASS